MGQPEVRTVVDLWCDQFRELGALDDINYVQIFENRGAMMGASNPHPHCQLWATEHVPNEPAREWHAFAAYAGAHNGACLLCEYLSRESDVRERIVCENDRFAAVVPFWAVWPFETLVISRRHAPSLAALDPRERDALADVLRRLTMQYDALFGAPFPYSMGFHQSPTKGNHPAWHFHAHFYPPLLRSATVRKFMVGFEMLGTPQRDITPELAAEKLRALVDKRNDD